LEILKESVRRSIQAAIGASPLPTQAQRHNEKSGVALKQIEDTAQKGSFHFVDHYDEAICAHRRHPEREHSVLLRHGAGDVDPDEGRLPAMVRSTIPGTADAHGQPLPHVESNQEAGPRSARRRDAGDHDVTISVGPRHGQRAGSVVRLRRHPARVEGDGVRRPAAAREAVGGDREAEEPRADWG
jgi:hypothetical protein